MRLYVRDHLRLGSTSRKYLSLSHQQSGSLLYVAAFLMTRVVNLWPGVNRPPDLWLQVHVSASAPGISPAMEKFF